jgi:hypothetical protein
MLLERFGESVGASQVAHVSPGQFDNRRVEIGREPRRRLAAPVAALQHTGFRRASRPPAPCARATHVLNERPTILAQEADEARSGTS